MVSQKFFKRWLPVFILLGLAAVSTPVLAAGTTSDPVIVAEDPVLYEDPTVEEFLETVDIENELLVIEGDLVERLTRDVHALRFIKRARNLGFSVDQIQRLVALWRERQRSSAEVKGIALEHVAALERKIAELQSMADLIAKLKQIGGVVGSPRRMSTVYKIVYMTNEQAYEVDGIATRVNAELSDVYFQSRPRESQLGAWASPTPTRAA